MSQYARFIVADVFDGLASLPDNSVDLIITSPPFLALRSYLPADSPLKAKEIGSEATPGEFIDVLLDVVEACERVLAPHGSLVVELGDTYSGSGGGGGDYLPGGWREGQPGFGGSAERQREGNVEHWRMKNRERQAWPLDKSLAMLPESFRWALAYGRNPFNGRTTPPWRLRNVHPWVRPNPPVGALGDKWRPATSYLVSACKGRERWFDLDAVRRPGARDYSKELPPKGVTEFVRNGKDANHVRNSSSIDPAGAPPLDWIMVPTEPYSGAHYATWPRRLVLPFVESMCPRRVCEVCRQPSRRITETVNAIGIAQGRRSWRADPTIGAGHTGEIVEKISSAPAADVRTLGWTDCGHDAWRPGLVLDPFAGSGATLDAAFTLGRSAIGIDIDARNADLARQRVGMWLKVEELVYPSEEAPA